jgi:hypothetical protein
MKRTAWWAYEFLALLVIGVTGIDIWWSVALVETLPQNELNPVARWIIGLVDFVDGRYMLPHSGVALLCALKVLGTWVALSVCRYLVRKWPRVGWPALIGLAVLQLLLAWFLFFGHVVFSAEI